MITSSYLNKKNKQKQEDLVHSKFKDIIYLHKNFCWNFFSKTKILPNSQGGLDEERLDSVEYGNKLLLRKNVIEEN